ncbi:hypothetical protein PRIPAC_79403 [Pristionchus pacificus]|uniref:G protein-coupled receptor n=1 Tax=Pristionchus pacificus TaxID=54126 RepID=A0A2A6CN70_PRIPA|nr:hypothetical protein PRIPAC_79403 [Pristionchus pacificus]|eukprot:PDM79546.1 G protein-coupled receptor [Pristionchus pacificus]
MEVSTVFISINSIMSVLGIIANLILITLILTKTPANIRTYTRLVLCAAVCDLTGITMFPLCMPRLHNIPRGMVIIFYFYLHEKVCWASFGITEQLIIVNDALICLSFVYRLHATTRLPPATYKIFVAVALVVCFTLTTSVGYYRLLKQARKKGEGKSVSTASDFTVGQAYASNTTDEEFTNFTNVPHISGFLDFTFDETPVVLSWTNFGAEVLFGSAILLRLLTARKFKSLQALNAQLLILFCFVVAASNVAIDLYRIVESDIPGFIVLPVRQMPCSTDK